MMSQIFSPCFQQKSQGRAVVILLTTLFHILTLIFFNNAKQVLNFTDLFNRSDNCDHVFFQILYNYSYNFIKISLLSFIIYTIEFTFISLFFLDKMFSEGLK